MGKKENGTERTADLMEVINDYLAKCNDEVRNTESKYMNIYATMYSVLIEEDLEDVETVGVSVFYAKPNETEKRKYFKIGNPFKASLSANEVVGTFRTLLNTTSKRSLEGQEPYTIILEACFGETEHIELVRYEFDYELQKYLITKNDRFPDELKKHKHVTEGVKEAERVGERVKALIEEDGLLKPKGILNIQNGNIMGSINLNEGRHTCNCCETHIESNFTGDVIPTAVEKLVYNKKMDAVANVIETYKSILTYGKPYAKQRRLTEARIAFLEDFANMIASVSIPFNNGITFEIESIASTGQYIARKSKAISANIFSRVLTDSDIFEERVVKFVEEVVDNPLVDVQKIIIYITVGEYTSFAASREDIDKDPNGFEQREALYFVKRDNEWVHHESLRYGAMKGDK